MKANINFQSVSPSEITKRIIPYCFTLIKSNGSWFITNIDSQDLMYQQFVENLPSAKSTDYKTMAIEAKNLAESSLPDATDLNLLRYGNANSNESIAKQEYIEQANASVSTRSATIVFDPQKAIAYADLYALSNSPYFYVADNDCTNFVSQAVWAGYGGWVSGDASTNASHVSSHYRMYYTGGSNWYANDWFGNLGGGSSAWENVSGHWHFVTNNSGYGPRGGGFNDNRSFFETE
jgi:hypothetical protein